MPRSFYDPGNLSVEYAIDGKGWRVLLRDRALTMLDAARMVEEKRLRRGNKIHEEYPELFPTFAALLAHVEQGLRHRVRSRILHSGHASVRWLYAPTPRRRRTRFA